jgi:aldose 1-epimerase
MINEIPIVRIESGDNTAQISPKGAYISQVSLAGSEILKESEDKIQTHGGCAILIPYSGRVRNGVYYFEKNKYQLPINDNFGNSIHGFAKERMFEVDNLKTSTIKLSTVIDEPSYPSKLRISADYTVDKGSFRVKLIVSNIGFSNAPLIVGAHPYFIYDRDWEISFSESLSRFDMEDSLFPSNTARSAKTSYKNEPKAFGRFKYYIGGGTIKFFNGKQTLVIKRRNMQYLTIYVGEFTRNRSVAIEPQSGLPDAFNNKIGLKVIRPQNKMEFSFQFEVK